jgi:hypothetical protein
MFRYTAGEKVKPGCYFNRTTWDITVVPRGGTVLKGAPEERYMRVPTLAFLVMAPLMGLAYAMFLPFIGFAMLASFLYGKVTGRATPLTPAPRPQTKTDEVKTLTHETAAVEPTLPKAA